MFLKSWRKNLSGKILMIKTIKLSSLKYLRRRKFRSTNYSLWDLKSKILAEIGNRKNFKLFNVEKLKEREYQLWKMEKKCWSMSDLSSAKMKMLLKRHILSSTSKVMNWFDSVINSDFQFVEQKEYKYSKTTQSNVRSKNWKI